MTEKLLQFIWQHSYFTRHNLQTNRGEAIEIVHGGIANQNQGPDFLEARIRIGKTLLAGSVELHLKTSGWKKHGHSRDPNYNNVILHVVYENDDNIDFLPLLELRSLVPRILLDRYEQFMQATQSFACTQMAGSVSSLVWTSWKDRLLVERLTRKSARVLELFQKSNGHWEETFWWLLARNFGGTINGPGFEEMAFSISTVMLAKHKSSIHQLEALLFGQANLLNGKKVDTYATMLQKEYRFLQKNTAWYPYILPSISCGCVRPTFQRCGWHNSRRFFTPPTTFFHALWKRPISSR